MLETEDDYYCDDECRDDSKELTVGSAFTGVGGFDLGFENAGFKTIWQIEWEREQQTVLKKQFPDVKIYGDINKVEFNELEKPDVFTYGFPCQDLSVSNSNRKGLDGKRSGQFFKAVELIQSVRPRICIAENVLGLLSSGKREDFGRLLKALASIGHTAIGWTVLDSQYFGVAQRRRRVFIVSANEIDRPVIERLFGEIQPISKGLSGIDSESRSIGEHDPSQTEDSTGETVGFPVTGGKWKGCFTDNLSPTIRVGSGLGIPSPPAVGFQRSQLRTKGRIDELDISPTLKAQTKSGDSELNVLQGFRLERFGNSKFSEDGTASTLKKRDYKDSTDLIVSSCPQRLYESHPSDSRTKGPLDVCPTITKRWGTGGNNTPLAEGDMLVRRLTPLECERLQGFPDGWTAYGTNEHGDLIKISDTKRYQMMGNAVTVTVAQYIAEKLGEILLTQ